MYEKVLDKIDSLMAELFGEITEADDAYDNEWCGRILAKQEVLNELREFVVNLQEKEVV